MAEAKKLVPDPPQLGGHPEPPRIKLKMGTRTPEPAAQRLTLKMRGQVSETASKDDRLQAGVSIDNESLRRQQDHVRAGSSQEVDAPRMSPRTRTLRRHMESPKSSAATTPSASEQLHHLPSHGRDTMGVIKNESLVGPSQHTEERPSNGQHGPLVGSPNGVHVFDSKPSLFTHPRFKSVLTLRPLQAPHQHSLDAPPVDSLWRKQGQGLWYLAINIDTRERTAS